jgi:hypothetical protein
MSRSLRIPWVVDLLRVDAGSDIAVLAGDGRLDRRFEPRGPLLNRILAWRVRNVLRVGDEPLPTVTSRQDMERARRQEQLRRRLDPALGHRLWDDETLAELADAVRGGNGARSIGPATQQAVGRLFVPGYRSSAGSWNAAGVLNTAVQTRNPLVSMLLHLSGRLRRSRQLLSGLVEKDAAGVHATGIAVHNLVRGFEHMRELWRDPRFRSRSAADAVVAKCLFAPPSVLRQATIPGDTVAGSVRAGTLVLLELDAAHARTPGPDIAFMADNWARCPAAAFVPALLRAVFERAADAEAAEARS